MCKYRVRSRSASVTHIIANHNNRGKQSLFCCTTLSGHWRNIHPAATLPVAYPVVLTHPRFKHLQTWARSSVIISNTGQKCRRECSEGEKHFLEPGVRQGARPSPPSHPPHMTYSFGKIADVYYISSWSQESEALWSQGCVGGSRFAIVEHLQLLWIHPQRVVAGRRISWRWRLGWFWGTAELQSFSSESINIPVYCIVLIYVRKTRRPLLYSNRNMLNNRMLFYYELMLPKMSNLGIQG